MDFRSLNLFVHLSSTLHFARTSQACNISPSALSRTIQRLEQETGQKLFIRDNRSAELTPEGRRFLHFAHDVISRWDDYKKQTEDESSQIKGELKIYSSVTASYSILTGLFSQFRKLYPDVHINLQTGAAENAIQMVKTGQADITVAAKPDRLSANMKFRTIAETPLVLVSPMIDCEVSNMIRENGIPWSEVPMIMPEQGISRKRINHWFSRKGIKPRIYAEVAGHEAIISMVHLGCGVGVVPLIVLENSTLRHKVRLITIEQSTGPYSVGLCVLKKRLNAPVVKAFWETEASL